MARHQISNANELFYGNTYHRGAYHGHRGIPFHPLTLVALGAPASVTGNGLANDIVLDDGIAAELGATLDVARNVSITSSADDSGISYTLRGFDQYGERLSETIAGANTAKAFGAKAFYRVVSVTANGTPAGTVDIGWGRALGLPFVAAGGYQIVAAFADDAEDGAGTLVAADASPATDHTGDVRGTYDPATTPDGAIGYHLWVYIDPTNAYGVKQA